MFRRHWSGLPKDADFPSDLASLGYFINDEDEIRSIENPDNYFHFWINRNDRINRRQVFEFSNATDTIIQERLLAQGMTKVTIPLGTSISEPHVPILISKDLQQKQRAVVFIGESHHSLGVLAGRVIDGPSGINAGSLLPVAQLLQKQSSSRDDPNAPGFIVLNPGETYWWPEQRRALTLPRSTGIKMPSVVHTGRKHIESLHSPPRNETPHNHIEYMFKEALTSLISPTASIDIIAVGDGCDVITKFLDLEENWQQWGARLSAMLMLGTVYPVDDLMNVDLKTFLATCTRGYAISEQPINTPLACPQGNPVKGIPALGCPMYSASEPWYTEMILIRAQKEIMAWLEQASVSPDYENELIVTVDQPQKEGYEDIETAWQNLPQNDRPLVELMDVQGMQSEVDRLERWDYFVKTGEAPPYDSNDEEEGTGKK